MRLAFKLTLVLMSALVGASAFFAFKYWRDSSEPIEALREQNMTVTHVATNMRTDFYESLNPAWEVPLVATSVKGLITSHHLFMEARIGKLFRSVQKQRPSVVVVVGPNHFSAGAASVQVSGGDFVTPFGTLRNASEITQKILTAGVALAEERPFDAEHAIGAVTPYIASVWPETTIVPIIMKRTATEEQVSRLAKTLNATLPEDALVVASVDFSHHLDRFSAAFHDAQSVDALASGDVERLGIAEVDSPQALSTVLQYLGMRNALHMEWDRIDQAVYTPDLLSNDVTSYVFATFADGKPAPAGVQTVMHYGLLPSENMSEQIILQMGDAEGNYFRGGDLKVLGVPVDSGCTVPQYSRLQKFGVKVFPLGACEQRVDAAEFTFVRGIASLARVSGQDRETRQLVVQIRTHAEVSQAIQLGADAVFVEQGNPSVRAQNGVPIISIAPGRTFGLGVGLVFTEDGATVYVFPYGQDGGMLARLTTEQRVQICNAVISPNLPHDACIVEIQK
ncbi:MAG: AmmeMemoRadiSam system protein B [Candidatus Doudnabacteria bacterium]|nr:AmmeMemoRadiSam system protein B [Candidatus Doudnabacteria bacterium]